MNALTGDDLRALVGTEIGSSDCIVLDQDRISRFASLTEDEQFIDIDSE